LAVDIAPSVVSLRCVSVLPFYPLFMASPSQRAIVNWLIESQCKVEIFRVVLSLAQYLLIVFTTFPFSHAHLLSRSFYKVLLVASMSPFKRSSFWWRDIANAFYVIRTITIDTVGLATNTLYAKHCPCFTFRDSLVGFPAFIKSRLCTR
jgi:hypothetical protein